MDQESFEGLYSYILVKIRDRFLNQDITVFDGASDMIDVVTQLIASDSDLRGIFLTLKTPDMAQWIPGPGGINLEGGIGSATGDLLENSSILGPFFKIGFLPCHL